MGHEFADHTVLITGALGALGQHLCFRFAEEGAMVLAGIRGAPFRFDAMREKAISQSLADSVHPVFFDVTDEAAVDQAISDIIERYGSIDVLINNAGRNETAPFMMQPSEVWAGIVETNLVGTRNICAAVSKPMMARKGGVIINISSVLATTLGRGASAYAASKAALNRFTEVAAVELGKKGVRVNSVSPGLLEAGMGEGMLSEATETALKRIPLCRKGRLSEVSDAVLFLASRRATYITGHTLNVDGGLSHG